MNIEETIKKHIARVHDLMYFCSNEISRRAFCHDKSKLQSPEKELYEEITPQLSELKYGSQEYLDVIAKLSPALKHHYENNSHHPEHYIDGMDGMDLFDIMELFCDWKAASESQKNGSFADSIRIGQERFNISPQLVNIFVNTMTRYIKFDDD